MGWWWWWWRCCADSLPQHIHKHISSTRCFMWNCGCWVVECWRIKIFAALAFFILYLRLLLLLLLLRLRPIHSFTFLTCSAPQQSGRIFPVFVGFKFTFLFGFSFELWGDVRRSRLFAAAPAAATALTRSPCLLSTSSPISNIQVSGIKKVILVSYIQAF